ncbi:hypothetical protein CI102_8714 [Trichoderma harzianum]|nr:hypothetical protein CI102_8714 [Trichoderma harzianum]
MCWVNPEAREHAITEWSTGAARMRPDQASDKPETESGMQKSQWLRVAKQGAKRRTKVRELLGLRNRDGSIYTLLSTNRSFRPGNDREHGRVRREQRLVLDTCKPAKHRAWATRTPRIHGYQLGIPRCAGDLKFKEALYNIRCQISEEHVRAIVALHARLLDMKDLSLVHDFSSVWRNTTARIYL